MKHNGLYMILGALFLLAAVFINPVAAASDDEKAPRWIVDHDNSSLLFESKQMGAAFTGSFENFEAVIHFDPDDLDSSHVRVQIMMDSADARSRERNNHIKTGPWFDVENYPLALFETQSFEKTGTNEYIAQADLTIRDVTLPVRLPFTLEITESEQGAAQAAMTGTLALSRLEYNVGTGEWTDTAMVPEMVTVTVSLTATRATD